VGQEQLDFVLWEFIFGCCCLAWLTGFCFCYPAVLFLDLRLLHLVAWLPINKSLLILKKNQKSRRGRRNVKKRLN